MDEVASDTIAGLIWYAQCRQLALQQIQSFRPPADLQAMRLCYGLYLMHLHSLLDLAKEEDSQVLARWEADLEWGGLSGSNNARFLRELRNAIVHRGADVTMRGTIVNGHVCAVSPFEVWGRETRGRRTGPFSAFESLLWNMFVVAEDALVKTLKPLVRRIETQLLAYDEREGRNEFLKAVSDDAFLPDWVKSGAHETAAEIPFGQIAAQRFVDVQRFLGKLGAFARLEA